MYSRRPVLQFSSAISSRKQLQRLRASFPHSQSISKSGDEFTYTTAFVKPIYRNIRTKWDLRVPSLCLNFSTSASLAESNIPHFDVDVNATPYIHLPENFKEPTSEAINIVATKQKHRTLPRTIFDTVKSFQTSFLAHLPTSRSIEITYRPIFKTSLGANRPHFPTLSIRKTTENPGNTESHTDTACNTTYTFKTEWQLPSSQSQNKTVVIFVTTKEHCTPSASDLRLLLLEPSEEKILGRVDPTFDVHQKSSEFAVQFFEESEETAAIRLARLIFKLADEQFPCKRLDGVEITMQAETMESFGTTLRSSNRVSLDRDPYEQSQNSAINDASPDGSQPAYIALGSNIGDRIGAIESACQLMCNRGLKVIRTSALYETKAMYVEDQQAFINGACEISTTLSPLELLDQLKSIENDLGRKKTIEKGPRTIDLDILLYGNQVMEIERLSIPHKLMLEREFVLRPLCDLIPNGTMPNSNSAATFKERLDNLPPSSEILSPLTPLAPQLAPLASQSPTRPTHIMAILNLTPDSFSDGGLHSTTDPASLTQTLQTYLAAPNPITILDVGGQSTRPHAPQISPEEELSRILPTIKSIRANPSFNKLAISVDTYRASVAAAAISAGANIINDVSAGQLDPEMLPTIASLNCTCILMHMRGTPSTMTTLTSYPAGIIPGVATELLTRVREAEAAGIKRWRIILDPGIGFAKTQSQNLELLRRFHELRNFEGLRGFPWVVGASRKKFIGKITGVEEARERKWGTAAAVTAAVSGGADVVRVHDVVEMGQVVRMADAIWRVQ